MEHLKQFLPKINPSQKKWNSHILYYVQAAQIRCPMNEMAVLDLFCTALHLQSRLKEATVLKLSVFVLIMLLPNFIGDLFQNKSALHESDPLILSLKERLSS